MYIVTCPKQGLEMEAAVLHRVAFLEYFCPKQGQDFKPFTAPLYPNMACAVSEFSCKIFVAFSASSFCLSFGNVKIYILNNPNATSSL